MKSFRTVLACVAALCAVALRASYPIALSNGCQATEISCIPSKSSVAVGERFTVTLTIETAGPVLIGVMGISSPSVRGIGAAESITPLPTGGRKWVVTAEYEAIAPGSVTDYVYEIRWSWARAGEFHDEWIDVYTSCEVEIGSTSSNPPLAIRIVAPEAATATGSGYRLVGR